jgi:hypothetical protein
MQDKEDMKIMQVKRWWEKIRKRDEWRSIVREAKAHPGLKGQGRIIIIRRKEDEEDDDEEEEEEEEATTQDESHFFRNPNVHYRTNNSTPLVPRMNTA